MALDDYIEPEIAIAVAVTAAVASPPGAREFLAPRTGLRAGRRHDCR